MPYWGLYRGLYWGLSDIYKHFSCKILSVVKCIIDGYYRKNKEIRLMIKEILVENPLGSTKPRF